MKKRKNNKTVKKNRLYPIELLVALLLFVLNCHAQDTTSKEDRKVFRLSEVGITWSATSGEESFAASKIQKKDIDNNIGNGSINNIFDLIPSMVTTSDAGTGIGYTYMRIRGIDQTRINVTINGVALNDAESQGSWFVNLPDFGAKVDNLTVQRGVGTSNNGSAAFGASMNFNTLNNDDKPFLTLNSSAGSFYTFRNSITAGTGLVNKRFSALFSFSDILSKGYIERTNANLYSLYFNANYYINHNNCLKFNVLHGKEVTGLSWDGVPSSIMEDNPTYNNCGQYYDDNGNEHFYENETDNYKQTHYQLFYYFNRPFVHYENNKNITQLVILKAGMHLTRGIGYYEQYKDDKSLSSYGLNPFSPFTDTLYISDLITRKYLDNYFYGMNLQFSHKIMINNSLNGNHNEFEWSLGGTLNQYDGLHYGTIIWMQYAGIVPPNYHWYDGTGEKTNLNLFGTFSYRYNNIYCYIDLQYRHIQYNITGTKDNLSDITQDYSWNFFNPKMGINYLFGNKKRNELYLSLAISNREPTRTDIIDAPNGNKPLPERLYNSEFGYRINLKKYKFNANYYAMFYHNQLVLTGLINDVGDAIMTNVEKSYRTGIELVSAYNPVSFFTWRINTTFSINKIINYTEYVDDWDSGIQHVNHLGNSNISFSPNIILANEFIFTPLKNFDISFITKYVGKQYIDNSSQDAYSLKPYCINNLHLSYSIETKTISKIALFFHLNNLFNVKYQSNAWVYRYYENGTEQFLDGYFPQAGINFMGGIQLTF